MLKALVVTSPLTPLSFLARSATLHDGSRAVIADSSMVTYGELAGRCRRLAGALARLGVTAGDRVSVLAPNTQLALDAHFGVPASGGVLNMLNTRLSAVELRSIIEHVGSRIVLADRQLAPLARKALGGLEVELVVDDGAEGRYESLLRAADEVWETPDDENALLAVNYTSGTTGQPKGVMYTHRGAYLQALAMQVHVPLTTSSCFLWTLPMFHCNGWCFPWAVTAAGATHMLLRSVDADDVWTRLSSGVVTHFNAAPTVLSDLVRAERARPLARPVVVSTGGSPPSPDLLGRLARLNFDVTHLYGLTESYGPALLCEWKPDWEGLEADVQYRLRARQGVSNIVADAPRVVRLEEGQARDVPADGATVGEVWLRGNNVTTGYYRDPEGTRAAFHHGWFRTGDLAVVHSDSYIELRDRSKDVIISGGENISSVEVEQVLTAHPAVEECAVVAAPHPRWGEVPVAFVTLATGRGATEEELIAHVQGALARFKAPKRVLFEALPRTATGKIRKAVLRDRIRDSDPFRDPT